jgi:hypothetical protein
MADTTLNGLTQEQRGLLTQHFFNHSTLTPHTEDFNQMLNWYMEWMNVGPKLFKMFRAEKEISDALPNKTLTEQFEIVMKVGLHLHVLNSTKIDQLKEEYEGFNPDIFIMDEITNRLPEYTKGQIKFIEWM